MGPPVRALTGSWRRWRAGSRRETRAGAALDPRPDGGDPGRPRHSWSVLFSALAGAERVRAERVVVTLLAVLELVRLQQARAQQRELFGDIVIERQLPAPRRRRRMPWRLAPMSPMSKEGDPTAEIHATLAALEALLFASDARSSSRGSPRSSSSLGRRGSRAALAVLTAACDAPGAGWRWWRSAGGYRLVTRSELAPLLVRLQRLRPKSRLSRAAVETLAIIAYRQPISRPEIEQLRGVNADAAW